MWKYIGGGSWLPGVPARDLTNAEAKAHGVEDSGLYEKAVESPGPEPDVVAEDAEPGPQDT